MQRYWPTETINAPTGNAMQRRPHCLIDCLTDRWSARSVSPKTAQKWRLVQKKKKEKKLTGIPLERSTDHFQGKWCNFNHIGYIHWASCKKELVVVDRRGWRCDIVSFYRGGLGGLGWGHSEALERAAWLEREHFKYWQAALETGLGVQGSYWAIVAHHTG